MAKKPAPKKAAKPVKKTVPKKAIKPAKKASPVKKTVTKKPVAKKAVAKKVVKAKPATANKAAKPVKKSLAKSPVKKAVAKKAAPAKKKVAVKPVPKAVAKKAPVAKVPAKAVVPVKSKPAPAPKTVAAKPVTAKAPAEKPAPAPKPVAKAPVKKEKKEKKADIAKANSKPLVTQTSAPIIHRSAPMVKKQVSTLEAIGKERYNDSELDEFRGIINAKLDEARKDYDLLKQTLANNDNNGTEDTSPSFKMIEDGSETLSREETAQLAGRQEKFIKHLEDALLRIRNKTYGICRVTGRLISKERLRLVPHATLSIEAKQQMSN